MRFSESERVIRCMKFLLGLIGEPHGHINFVLHAASREERRYAVFSAGDSDGDLFAEQVVLYVNDNVPLLPEEDLSVEEIAIHEVRHVIQYRRGSQNYDSYLALWRRMALSVGNDRTFILFRGCCTAARGDALEADAMFVTALAYDLDYPVHEVLVL